MGFLKGRRIQDVIGTTHESLHSIKKKKLKALVLKLDLRKAFDCVDWEFLRLILLKIGLGIHMTNWIMSCVSTSSFVVLINGEATDFFRSGRGVRQGCPLSPLLFILVMEGLNRLLKHSFEEGLITGIRISRVTKILHIFFVDDVLILSKADLMEWKVIDSIINLFCKASGLLVNTNKSTVHFEGVSEEELTHYKTLLPYNFSALSLGFRYLGYYLKTGIHHSADWDWMIDKFTNKIKAWYNIYLSLGGRYILVKTVLEAQTVYWMTMEALPHTVLNKLRTLMFQFLWKGQSDSHRFHLCSWEVLSRPKKNGGWGLRNLSHFNLALNAITLWRVLTQPSIWQQIIRDKYLKNVSLINWIRRPSHLSNSASKIWSCLTRALPSIIHWLSWCPGTGQQIIVGRDRILGIGDASFLSEDLLYRLNQKHITTLAHASLRRDPLTLAEVWRSSSELEISGDLGKEWDFFTQALSGAGIYFPE
jgi:hypothetical protein